MINVIDEVSMSLALPIRQPRLTKVAYLNSNKVLERFAHLQSLNMEMTGM
jgi:hypothetical protein